MYTFFPWARTGLGQFLEQVENVQAAGQGPAAPRSKFKVTMHFAGADGSNPFALDKWVEVQGPGDVRQILPEAFLRTSPPEGFKDAEYAYLPTAEFYDEDFPWRYTPAQPAGNDPRLRPWICLMVLKKDEFKWVGEGVIEIRRATALQAYNLAEAWRWAHVQVNMRTGAGPRAVEQIVATDPDMAISRLISLRPLEPGTAYHVFVVPTFEQGRLRGLDLPIPLATPLLQPAWSANTPVGQPGLPFHLPVYKDWSFETGLAGSFQELFQRVRFNGSPLESPEMDIRDLYADLGVALENTPSPPAPLPGVIGRKQKDANPNPAQALQINPVLSLNPILGGPVSIGGAQTPLGPVRAESTGRTKWKTLAALKNVGEAYVYFGDDNNYTHQLAREQLAVLLEGAVPLPNNGSADPYLDTPPLYGAWHAARHQLLAQGALSDKPYLEQINLDPALRAVAGLGLEVVRDNQEEFMAHAWQQVDEILEANKKINQTQFAILAGEKLYARHVAARGEDEIVKTASSLLGKVLAQGGQAAPRTLLGELEDRDLPQCAADAALLKAARRKSPASKFLHAGRALSGKLTAHLANTALAQVSGAQPKLEPDNMYAANEIASQAPNTLGAQFVQRVGAMASPPIPQADANAGFVLRVENALKTQLRPQTALEQKLRHGLHVALNPEIPHTSSGNNAPLAPIMVAPKMSHRTYRFLAEKRPEFILPDIERIPYNSVTLTEVNDRFVEAFLVGMNHAFAQELLFRDFPTDQRGTYFQRFWDSTDDLNANSPSALGGDISRITDWAPQSKLGEHPLPGSRSPQMVLALRGDLFRAYPNLIFFAQKADPNGLFDANGETRYACFKHSMNDDVSIVGFDIEPAEAKGEVRGNSGWFFLVKERQGETRFGYQISNGALVLAPSNGPDSAKVAHDLYRQPYVCGMHFRHFLTAR